MFFADNLGPAFPKRFGADLYRVVVEKTGRKDTVSRDELRKIVGDYLKQLKDDVPVDQAIAFLLNGQRIERVNEKTYRIVRM